jgi:glycerophosphoryl diester phosphodiesterase
MDFPVLAMESLVLEKQGAHPHLSTLILVTGDDSGRVRVLDLTIVIRRLNLKSVYQAIWPRSLSHYDAHKGMLRDDPGGIVEDDFELNREARSKYSEIEKFDCGKKVHPRFPQQRKMSAKKPLLSEVIDRVEKYVLWNNIKAVTYNIEIKSKPEGDYIYHPTPDKFASLMYDLLREKNITKRVIIQSFDIRPLQVMHYIDPTIKTSLLLEGDFNLKNELQRLGFNPNYVSPDFTTVNAAMVKYVHSLGIRIIPWTVNELEDIYKMEALGVDGIISDYPNRALPSVY